MWANTLFEHSGYYRAVKLTVMKIIILQSFRSNNIDGFSYSIHKNLIRTRWDQLCEKIFVKIFTCGCISLLCTLKEYTNASVKDKISQKIKFFGSRFFQWRRLGGQNNVRNTLIRSQMTSQIGCIDILHTLGGSWDEMNCFAGEGPV